MMHFLGYAMAMVTGLTLGLMGSGGSIVTVPVLVYLFRMNPVLATSYSLFVVGVTSLIGLSLRVRGRKVNLRAALAFALPSLATVYLVRKYLIHELPQTLRLPFGHIVTRDDLIMVFFSLVMLAAALSMLLKSKARAPEPAGSGDRPQAVPKLFLLGLEGVVVGSITGLVGAGGGFLIVPILILLGRLSLETAIGTSLAIITAQSFVGFLTDVSLLDKIEWDFLLRFSGLSVTGVLAGSFLARYTRDENLKRGFGWFTLIIALLILGRELITGGA
ncbi:MAG: sulfite exporter TauE/SafE family protein [Fibrobacteria bacterium]